MVDDFEDYRSLNIGVFSRWGQHPVRKIPFDHLAESDLIVVFISGRDIAEILIKAGYNTKDVVEQYLQTEFPT